MTQTEGESQDAQSFDLMLELDDDNLQGEVTGACGCKLECTEYTVGFIFCELHRRLVNQFLVTGDGCMSDDEARLLYLLLGRHGASTLLAWLSVACSWQAGDARQRGDAAGEERWEDYSQRLMELADLPKPTKTV